MGFLVRAIKDTSCPHQFAKEKKMSDKHPKTILIDASEYSDHTGKCYDAEAFTHAENDTLYVRQDKIFEYLLEQGYNITVAAKD